MMRNALLFAAILAASPVRAQIAPPVRHADPGVVDAATSAELAPLLRQLGDAYARAHPGFRLRLAPRGSNVAMALLTTAQADLAVIGREAGDQEAKGFEWVYPYPPTARPLLDGAAALPGHSPRIAAIVADASPLRSITMAELAARFRVGGTGRIAMPDIESGTGRFFRHVVLADANQLDWDRISEFTETDHARPGMVADRIAALVARDPGSIGIADAAPRKGVREIPVTDAGDRLGRQVMLYMGRLPRAEVAGFIQFIDSDAARAIIAVSPYRPLRNRPATAP